jgi:hypothetical protein
MAISLPGNLNHAAAAWGIPLYEYVAWNAMCRDHPLRSIDRFVDLSAGGMNSQIAFDVPHRELE